MDSVLPDYEFMSKILSMRCHFWVEGRDGSAP